MPYIAQPIKRLLDLGVCPPASPGELTYVMTKTVLSDEDVHEKLLAQAESYLRVRGVKFATFAEILGAFTATELEYYRRTGHAEFFKNRMHCVQLARAEFYREVIAPYEDRKIAENGDVYPCDLLA